MGTDNGKQDNVKIVFVALGEKTYRNIGVAELGRYGDMNKFTHVKEMFRNCMRFWQHPYKQMLISPETQPKGMKYDNTARSDLRLWIESIRASR